MKACAPLPTYQAQVQAMTEATTPDQTKVRQAGTFQATLRVFTIQFLPRTYWEKVEAHGASHLVSAGPRLGEPMGRFQKAPRPVRLNPLVPLDDGHQRLPGD